MIPAGETLIGEGRPTDALWLVVRGRLRLTERQPDGTVRQLGDVTAGDCVGDLVAASAAVRRASR